MMKRKKVIHVLNTGSYSGAENVVITIIENMKDVDAYYVSLDGPIRNILEKKGIKFVPIDKLNSKNLKLVIKRINPDIIHAHDYTATIVSSLCFSHKTIISHIHNNSPWIKKFNLKSIVFLFSTFFCKEILTVSNSIENEYIFSKYIKKKIHCIGNPIDVDKVIYQAKEYESKKYDLIYLGRISEQKNPHLLLKIINELQKKIPNIKVAIIGNGDLFEELKNKIYEKKLEKNVTLYGFISNPYPILKNSKVLCLPSKWEGFGLVAVESLALGVPVVCSGVGGLSDLIDNECGMICSLDCSSYVEEIYILLNDYDYWQLKSKNALNKAQLLSNVSNYIELIGTLYSF